jgi:hypothetical protein
MHPSIWAHKLVGTRHCQAFWPDDRLSRVNISDWFYTGGIFLVNPALTSMTSLSSSLHQIHYSISLTIWIYTVLYLITVDVTLYHIKLLMFYGVQTTNLRFTVKYETYST